MHRLPKAIRLIAYTWNRRVCRPEPDGTPAVRQCISQALLGYYMINAAVGFPGATHHVKANDDLMCRLNQLQQALVQAGSSSPIFNASGCSVFTQ